MLEVNGETCRIAVEPGRYATIKRRWQSGDQVTLRLPMSIRMHHATSRNVQESRAPDGSPVQQQVLRFDYLALTRGPLVYATGLIDGYKIDETIRLPDAPLDAWLRLQPAPADEVSRVEMLLPDRAPIVFEPYFRAGGRMDGAWRLTWMSLAPPEAIAPVTNNL